jgi:hypothetical protein
MPPTWCRSIWVRRGRREPRLPPEPGHRSLPSNSCTMPLPTSPRRRQSSRWDGAGELRPWRRSIRAHRSRCGPCLRAPQPESGHPSFPRAATLCPTVPRLAVGRLPHAGTGWASSAPGASRSGCAGAVTATPSSNAARAATGHVGELATRRWLGEKASWGRGCIVFRPWECFKIRLKYF